MAGDIDHPALEETMTEQATPRILGVHTVGIPVSDQDRALAFYVGTLGLEKLMDAPLEQLGGRWIVVGASGSATPLALVPAHDGLPAGVETGIRLATDDAAGLHSDLRARGVDVGDLLAWPGVPPMFALRDQDGNGLSVTELGAEPAGR
jgi:catechol 2,3-dioxygenase-like lactoylglutathione lyase family enzyme